MKRGKKAYAQNVTKVQVFDPIHILSIKTIEIILTHKSEFITLYGT